MKRFRALLSVLLCGVLLFGAVPVVGAAETVDELNGIKIVYVSSFGRMSYEGTPKSTYKTLDAALAALPDGGRIIIQGNATITAAQLTSPAGPLTIAGYGPRATGNVITLNESVLALTNDLTFENICLRMPENGVINANGHHFTAGEAFDSYFEERYSTSGNVISYPAPISVSGGDVPAGETSEITLLSGHFGTLSSGIAGGKCGGNVRFTMRDVFADRIFAGAPDGSYSSDGDVLFDLDGVTLSDGLYGGVGTIQNGVVLLLPDLTAIPVRDFPGDLSIGAKSVLLTKGTALPDADNLGSFDIAVAVNGGRAEALFENGTLSGFRFRESNGFVAESALIDGVETTAENRIFTLTDGSHVVVPMQMLASTSDAASGAYVSGYEDGNFQPQRNLTRAEAVTTLSRLVVDEARLKSLALAEYDDVTDDDWYSPYIGFFQTLGCLAPLEDDGKILPEQTITRGEFCALLQNIYAILYDRVTAPRSFSDVSAFYPYADAVSFAGFTGIVTGYEDGTFRPDNPLTRAEAVTMINRMLGRTPADNDVVIFPDTAEHWARTQINAAANAAEKDGTVMWTKTGINHYDDYMQYRSSLTNTKVKLETEKLLNVAFIGGSITAGSGASKPDETSWRARTVQWFQNTYPDCTINQVNAAVGDSYTKYAVYRMDTDLLRYDYDIVFVEYAINDSPWYSAKQDSETIIYFETLIRRIYEHNPKADIVIVYTIDDKISRLPKYFDTAKAQEVIAAYYDIPSVNFGRALADEIANQNLKWGDRFADYVHPNDAGHQFYCAVLSEYLENALSPEKCGTAIQNRVLPDQHTKEKLWYDLTMLEASEVDLSLSKNWIYDADRRVLRPTDPDNELIIKTYGSDLCIKSPRGNEMFYSVDGGNTQFMTMNRAPQTLAENLDSTKEHTLRIHAGDITKLVIERVMYNGKPQ